MTSKLNYKRLIYMLITLFLLVVTVIGGRGKLSAFADTLGYTSVITDLQKDSSFNFGDYPEIENDYSLQVIQVAEGIDGDLFLYVYQPCQITTPLVATQINMSLSDKLGGEVANSDEQSSEEVPKLYGLTLINTWGVFAKYKVNGFTVSSEPVRYYNITSIYRKYNEDYGDTGSTSESAIDEKAFEVGKIYRVTVEHDNIKYECLKKETIRILNPVFGSLRFPTGYWLWKESCDSHYVAFSTDRKIDRLCDATVYYVSQPVVREHNNLFNKDSYSYKDSSEHYVKLSDKDMADIQSTGIFGHSYSWKRIQRAEDFVKDNDLSSEIEDKVIQNQWVLCFTETDYSRYSSGTMSTNGYSEIYVDVTDVTILELCFETDGVTYNLGAICDIGHSDGIPDNIQKNGFDFWEWLADLLGVSVKQAKIIFLCAVGLIVLAIALPVLSVIFPAFGQVLLLIVKSIGKALLWLVKGLWWLVCLPFKGIKALINKIRGE